MREESIQGEGDYWLLTLYPDVALLLLPSFPYLSACSPVCSVSSCSELAPDEHGMGWSQYTHNHTTPPKPLTTYEFQKHAHSQQNHRNLTFYRQFENYWIQARSDEMATNWSLGRAVST